MLINVREKQHAFPECGMRLRQADAVKRHMLIHKRILQKGVMRNHMLTHTREKLYVCPGCGKRFTLASQLKRHMLIHTRKTTCMSGMWKEVYSA